MARPSNSDIINAVREAMFVASRDTTATRLLEHQQRVSHEQRMRAQAMYGDRNALDAVAYYNHSVQVRQPQYAHTVPARDSFIITEDPVTNELCCVDPANGFKFYITMEQIHSLSGADGLRRIIADEYNRHVGPVPRAEYTRVQQELASLRTRFESLFGIPVDKVAPVEIGQVPDHPEQWRIKVRVEAFEVETTVGTMAAAQRNPKAAQNWMLASSQAKNALQADFSAGIENAQRLIMEQIIGVSPQQITSVPGQVPGVKRE